MSAEVTLQSSLSALRDASTPSIARLSRVALRAADDLEVQGAEIGDAIERNRVAKVVSDARNEVAAVRKRAHNAALQMDRMQLLQHAEMNEKEDANENGTMNGKGMNQTQLAKDINDRLRRMTNDVQNETMRSEAGGEVLAGSTRRLRITAGVHKKYGQDLSDGKRVLGGIKRQEVVANVVVALSLLLFFVAAAYVARRRLANSTVVTAVRTGGKGVGLLGKVAWWMGHTVGSGVKRGAKIVGGTQKCKDDDGVEEDSSPPEPAPPQVCSASKSPDGVCLEENNVELEASGQHTSGDERDGEKADVVEEKSMAAEDALRS